MILEVGGKVLVVHRRLFEGDKERFFVGTVDACESGVARVTGHTWFQDPVSGSFTKKGDVRTKVIALASQGLIIYALPSMLQMTQLKFDFSEKGQLWLLDSSGHFKMDLSENYHAI